MSNHLAVAAVTATVVQLLDTALRADFAGAHAAPARPGDPAGQNADPETRVFLYRVEPNPSWRNLDLPTRGSPGALLDVPQYAIDLHYLLTFVGNEADFEPQRLLGSAVRALHVHPILTRDEIARMVRADAGKVPPGPLTAADLDQQPDLVRFTPEPLTLDELSNLWSSFFQTEYRLSVAYRASVVLLTPDEVPVPALPVRERRLFVSTILRPRIRSVRAVGDESAPIVPGAAIEVLGSQLEGEEETVVRIGAVDVVIPPEEATAARLALTVPATVRPGATGVVVEHRRSMGAPPVLRPAGHSNVQPLVVHPVIQPTAIGHAVSLSQVTTDTDGTHRGVIHLVVEPPVAARQQVAVLLTALDDDTAAFTFPDESRDRPGDPETTTTLAVGFDGVPSGDYLVRVRIDGAESPLEVDTAPGPNQGRYVAPRIGVP